MKRARTTVSPCLPVPYHNARDGFLDVAKKIEAIEKKP
jgi:hypothetical protein